MRMIMQSKTYSFYESIANTAIGFAVNYVANLAILPLFGLHLSHSSQLLMTSIFTVISVLRGYVVRRLFNKIKEKQQ